MFYFECTLFPSILRTEIGSSKMVAAEMRATVRKRRAAAGVRRAAVGAGRAVAAGERMAEK